MTNLKKSRRGRKPKSQVCRMPRVLFKSETCCHVSTRQTLDEEELRSHPGANEGSQLTTMLIVSIVRERIDNPSSFEASCLPHDASRKQNIGIEGVCRGDI
mmetsp:Transcript_12638/g.31838  ORF Transcript_12638/g.31838 Transcript_12638/m.31838 type:complete len:101 (-) Transcript_12638:1949-2251(-)